METILAQEKAFNALIYFVERIKPFCLTKAIQLLYIANETAVKDSGVPITWINLRAFKFEVSLRKKFDDAQFSDYEIDILDSVINKYGRLTAEQLVEILQAIIEVNNLQRLLDSDFKKSAFEVAYLSYLMEANLV